jgi:hypothetical protein
MLSDRVSTVSGESFPKLSTPLNFPLKTPIDTVVMSSLRPVSLLFRRRRATPTVESLNERLGMLARDRQEMRAAGAGSVALERNRILIAGAQWELSYALIDRYLPQPAAAQSAA